MPTGARMPENGTPEATLGTPEATLVDVLALEVRRLQRARAIAHIMHGDPRGAMICLILQRDQPQRFDVSTFDGETAPGVLEAP